MRVYLPYRQCLVRIKQGTFKPLFQAPPIYSNPITLEIDEVNGTTTAPSSLAVTGPEKMLLLQIIGGKYLSLPPQLRVYPNNSLSHILLLNFLDLLGLDLVHVSARYESYSYKGVLEMADDVNCVRNYIVGANNYNSNLGNIDDKYVDQLIELFNLRHLQAKWINSLSNGQMRRARIAKALITKPRLLVIDDPFLGLDPTATKRVLDLLAQVGHQLNISMVLGLRTHDAVPEWIEKVAYIDSEGLKEGHVETVLTEVEPPKRQPMDEILASQIPADGAHISFNNALVVYRGLPVLKDFNWNIPKGTKWRILGDNGTGKTTILSLITADHPQLWRLVLSIDGQLRKTGQGINVFSVNNKIGILLPEIHAVVPRHLKTMREIIRNGLVPNIGNLNFAFSGDKYEYSEWLKLILDRFADRLQKVGHRTFNDLLITDQKLCLFLRAIVKQPEILILDEAFLCMDDDVVMQKCHDIVANDMPNTTVLSIGHLDWELAPYQYMVHLLGNDAREYKLYQSKQ